MAIISNISSDRLQKDRAQKVGAQTASRAEAGTPSVDNSASSPAASSTTQGPALDQRSAPMSETDVNLENLVELSPSLVQKLLNNAHIITSQLPPHMQEALQRLKGNPKHEK